MSFEFNGSSDFYEYEGVAINSTPVTMGAWVNPDSFTSPNYPSIVSVGQTAPGQGEDPVGLSSWWHLYLYTNGTVRFQVRSDANSPASGGAYNSTAATIGSWTHIVGVEHSTTDRRCFMDGVIGVNETNYHEPTDHQDTNIGVFQHPTLGRIQHWNGKLAEVFIFNVALSDTEVTNMYDSRLSVVEWAGLNGYLSNLVVYEPFVGKQDDWGLSLPFNTYGSPTVRSESHPNIRYPRRSPRYVNKSFGVGPAGRVGSRSGARSTEVSGPGRAL